MYAEVQPAKEPTESAGRRAPVVKPGNPREPELLLEVAGDFRGQVKRDSVLSSDFLKMIDEQEYFRVKRAREEG